MFVKMLAACLLSVALALPSQAQRPPGVPTDRNSPAVVRIQAKVPGIGTKSGSGFFVDPNGFVLTARRLIEGAGSLSVTTDTGTRLNATVVNYSTAVDAAVLKVDATDLPVLHLADSDAVRPGEEVLALGFPLGQDRSMALRRVVSEASDGGRIQIDESLTPGFVGGPVVTTTGEVIGIVEQTLTSVLAANTLRDLATPLSPQAITVPPVPASEYPLSGRWVFTLWKGSRDVLSSWDSFRSTCHQDREAVTCSEESGPHTRWVGRFDADTREFELSVKQFSLLLFGIIQDAKFIGKLVAPDKLEGEWVYRERTLFITWSANHGYWYAHKVTVN